MYYCDVDDELGELGELDFWPPPLTLTFGYDKVEREGSESVM